MAWASSQVRRVVRKRPGPFSWRVPEGLAVASLGHQPGKGGVSVRG